MAAESADILGDRHIVVVEHHEQRPRRGAGAAQRLICHAAGQCTVANDRDNVVLLVLSVRACAMPSATETESEACPVMHGSVMLLPAS